MSEPFATLDKLAIAKTCFNLVARYVQLLRRMQWSASIHQIENAYRWN